jgi:hypothetical protein
MKSDTRSLGHTPPAPYRSRVTPGVVDLHPGQCQRPPQGPRLDGRPARLPERPLEQGGGPASGPGVARPEALELGPRRRQERPESARARPVGVVDHDSHLGPLARPERGPAGVGLGVLVPGQGAEHRVFERRFHEPRAPWTNGPAHLPGPRG